jgi:hypothetical protein
MKSRCEIITCLLLTGWGISAQERPSPFELTLPDFFESSFPGGSKTIIEVPSGRYITRLRLLIRDAQKLKIAPGAFKIFVNGNGIGNVFEERTVPGGTLLVMEPDLLRRRPDKPFEGHEHALEVIAETKFRKWYGNWLIRENDKRENAYFLTSFKISPDDPKGLAPDLQVTEPTVPPVFSAGATSLQLHLKGITSRGASLLLNGAEFAKPGFGEIVEFDKTVEVTFDRKELRLEAVDEKGNQRQITIPVYETAEASRRPRFAGQKYAVVIGISRFAPLQGTPPAIPYASAEAEELANTLEKRAGFKHENIRLLTDEKANLENVRLALSDFAAKATSRDMLIVYMATHGFHDPRPGREERLYLASYGTRLDQLDASAMGFSDLEILLNRSVRTDHCFLIFDISHQLDADWSFDGGRHVSLVNKRIFHIFQDKPEWSALISGSAGEISGQHGKGDASRFNYWLLKGLEGAADISGDGVVTASELFQYVSEKVKQESGATQVPRFQLSATGGAVDLLP